MPHPSSDRAIRRLVADLATLHGDDIAAILDKLSVSERPLVANLLKEYATTFDDRTAALSEHSFDIAALSPWLAERLQSAAQPDRGMTERTRRALRECAAELFPVRRSAAQTPQGPRLFDRALLALSRTRRAT